MSLLFGSRKKDLEERMKLHDNDKLISARAYNLTIGAVLLWGFVLNYLLIHFFEDTFLELFTVKYPIWFLLIGYIICIIIGMICVSRKNALISFIGYNFVAVPIGIVLSVSLQGVDTDMIRQAIFITVLVTLIMFLLSILIPSFFLKMRRVLIFSLLACILAELICIFLFHHDPSIFDWITALILSCYIGYDWARANKCQKTMDNAIDIATALYIDIINLFMRVLEILQKNKN